jgi:hypothetical protein
MNRALTDEIRHLGGDPTDDVWRWLLLNGPHGITFTWRQTRSEPAGYVGVEHLQSIGTEKIQIDPTFLTRAKLVAEQALASTDPNFLCRAIQVAAVVGSDNELRRLTTFTTHEIESVAANARAGVFYLKRRLRSGATT